MMMESTHLDYEPWFESSSPLICTPSSSPLPILKCQLLVIALLGVIQLELQKLKLKEQQPMQLEEPQQIVLLWESLIHSLMAHLICVYSGTVAGAREPFLHGVPSLSISYDWAGGKSSVDDYKVGAEACLPLINAVLNDIRNGTYPKGSFLNIDLPTDILHHKGYKVTKQGKHMTKIGWKQVSSSTQGGKNPLTKNMQVDSVPGEEISVSSMPQEVFFTREIRSQQVSTEEDDADYVAVREGYITVTPIVALSNAEIDMRSYYKEWIRHVVPSAL